MTTRPTKEHELRPPSHAQFEINGFDSKEKIKHFASKFLRDQRVTEEFVEYLYEQKLNGIAEIPLLLLMLCLLWKEKDSRGIPTSRANIHERFVQTLFDSLTVKDLGIGLKSVDDYKEDLLIQIRQTSI